VSTGASADACDCACATAPPIPSAEPQHIFDPFSPLAAEAPPRASGLAVTHQIVVSHGGEIEVSSDQRGTEVTVGSPSRPGLIQLPRCPEVIEDEGSPIRLSGNAGRRRLADLLQRWGGARELAGLA
jgi:hypothetical protein